MKTNRVSTLVVCVAALGMTFLGLQSTLAPISGQEQEKKLPEATSIEAAFVGHYSIKVNGKGTTSEWLAMPDKTFQLVLDGNRKSWATWKAVGDTIVVTYDIPDFGTAVLKRAGDKSWVGDNKHRNGDVYHWVMTKTDSPVPKNAKGSDKPLPIDLLKAANPEKHSCKGKWEFQENALVSTPAGVSILEIPHTVPEEYTLKLQVERKAGNDALGIGLVVGDRRCLVVLDAGPKIGYLSGLEMIDGKSCGDNETTRKGGVLKDGVSSEVLCTVRRDGISVSVDGIKIIDFKGSWNRLSLGDFWKTPNDRALFVGSQNSTIYRISRMELEAQHPDRDPGEEKFDGAHVETFEGEHLKLLGKSGTFPVKSQDMQHIKDHKWSNDSHLLATSLKSGDWIELEIPVRRAAKYEVTACLTMAAEYGIVQFRLNGNLVGKPIDCFVTGKVVKTATVVLGTIDLNKGKAILNMTLHGRNFRSFGDRFALDSITLTAVGPTRDQRIEAAEKAEKEQQLALWNKMPSLPGVDGKNHSLSEYKKDVVVVCFLRNSCPVSASYKDKLIDFTKKYGDKVDFIAIYVSNYNNRDEDKLPEIRKRGFNFPCLFDEGKSIARTLGAKVTPHFFVFNKERKLIYKGGMFMIDQGRESTVRYLDEAVEAGIKDQTPRVMNATPLGCFIKLK